VQLAEAAGTTQRAISYYETEAGFPPAPAIIDLARALQIATNELLGVKPRRVQPVSEDPEARRQWKRFQLIASLPERGQKAVVRLIHSFVGAAPARRTRAPGERNGR